MKLPTIVIGILVSLALLVPSSDAQTAQAGQSPATDPMSSAAAAASSGAPLAKQPATLVYANRAIVEFRADLLMRTPAERSAAAVRYLDRLVAEAPFAQVAYHTVGAAAIMTVDDRAVFAIVPTDLDVLAGETLEQTARETTARLRLAFDEEVELRSPARLLRAGLLALGGTALYAGVLWLLYWIHRAGLRTFSRSAERQLERLPGSDALLRASGAPQYVLSAFKLVSTIAGLLVTYVWLMFVLRRFPYTRPWGESFRSTLLSAAASVGRLVVAGLPDLLTVVVIVLVTRSLARLVTRIFDAVEQERVAVPWLYAETAQPTRRIVVALLWVFALIVSYPYLPGSDSDVFKGVSVFVGLLVSLGSSGIMNQVMSGLTMTYSRALRPGDFVKVGDVEGTVAQLGTLSTKIKTVHNAEITIPNSVVMSDASTNYSRLAHSGVFVPTRVTIGYDVPWRQVRALLLLAAERTPGIRAKPEAVVRQTALLDFYVEYTLVVCVDQPHLRGNVLDALHANIQDAFNEHGVQIMSPNYEADPSAPKVVPKERWYATPAPFGRADQDPVGGK